MQGFPGGGQKQAISSASGMEPPWSRDGRQPFYPRDNEVFAVTVDLGPPLVVGGSAVLFARHG